MVGSLTLTRNTKWVALRGDGSDATDGVEDARVVDRVGQQNDDHVAFSHSLPLHVTPDTFGMSNDLAEGDALICETVNL